MSEEKRRSARRKEFIMAELLETERSYVKVGVFKGNLSAFMFLNLISTSGHPITSGWCPRVLSMITWNKRRIRPLGGMLWILKDRTMSKFKVQNIYYQRNLRKLSKALGNCMIFSPICPYSLTDLYDGKEEGECLRLMTGTSYFHALKQIFYNLNNMLIA